MQAVWWVIFGISVAAYVFLEGLVFWKIFSKTRHEFSCSSDRGLKNFKEANGRSIVYAPKPEYRKYIKQYILSERNGTKVIVCKLDESITCLDYDVVLFDNSGRAFKTVNVLENIEKPGYSGALELPSGTAYATLVINSANNVAVTNIAPGKISGREKTAFAAASGGLAVLEVFCVKLCFANIFGDVFAGLFMTSAGSVFITLGIGVLVALVNIAAAARYVKHKDKSSKERARL